MTLSKVHYIRITMLPSLIQKIGKLLEADLGQDKADIEALVGDMDQMVFGKYIERRAEPLREVISDGILHGGMDWLNAPKPSEVRPYMHRAILMLVDTHSRVGDLAPALLPRVLEALVGVVASVALECFQQIPKFGTGGMLTVSMTP